MSRFERFLPLTGVVAGVLTAFAEWWDTFSQPGSDPGQSPVVFMRWLDVHQAQGVATGVARAYLCLVLLLFTGALWRALRDTIYAVPAVAGAAALALASVHEAEEHLVQVGSAAQHDLAATTALGYHDAYGWLPWTVATGALLLAVGLGARQNRSLPKWLAVTTTVLGALAVTPAGEFVGLVVPVWFVAVGVLFHARERAVERAASSANGVPVGSIQ